MSKVIFALVTLSVNEENSVVRFDIFTLIIYVKAVKNSI